MKTLFLTDLVNQLADYRLSKLTFWLERKGKEEYLYSAILVCMHTLKALRHASHNCLPANNTMPAFPSGLDTAQGLLAQA